MFHRRSKADLQHPITSEDLVRLQKHNWTKTLTDAHSLKVVGRTVRCLNLLVLYIATLSSERNHVGPVERSFPRSAGIPNFATGPRVCCACFLQYDRLGEYLFSSWSWRDSSYARDGPPGGGGV
ncbi:hypothetical protein BJX70DRAFT_369597 [Aspergillus crustosus]